MGEFGKARLRAVCALHTRKGRERQGRTVIEGVRLLEAALSAGVQPEYVLFTSRLLRTARGEQLLRAAGTAGAQVYAVDEATMSQASGTETPQGILAVIPLPGTPVQRLLEQESPFLLAVDGVKDPGNLGTMLRTAAAAGVSGVLLGRGTVEIANPKVLRAAMGASFLVAIAEEVDLPSALTSMRERGVPVLAGDPAGERSLFEAEVAPPVVLVVGGEADGLTPEVAAVVTQRLRIPMAAGVESLNAGVAAALLLYEAARRR